MSDSIPYTITGNITADPELRTTSTGKSVCNFTIAQTPKKYNKQTNKFEDGETLFMRCTAWNDLAEHISQSLSKGCSVLAVGVLQQRSYHDREGNNRTVIELLVNDCGASLKYVTYEPVKAQRDNGFTGAQYDGGMY